MYMVNRLCSLVVLTVIMALFAGCRPVKPEPVTQAKPEQPHLEPTPLESQAEPVDANQPSVSPLHEQLTKLFGTYVDNEQMVKYEALRHKRRELISLLRQFSNITVGEYDLWDREEKKAFWINAYNLCTLKVIIDNYPIKPSRYKVFFGYPANSIMQISKPWTGFEFKIMGEKYTLRELERGVILRQFNDPRICLGLSHATLGGPALRNEPYTARMLDKQLDQQARAFISSPRGFKINRDQRKVYLAAIFKDSWYGNYFIRNYGTNKKFIDKSPSERAVLNFISNYIPRRDREFLVRKDYTVKYIKYNWALNGR